eukprot:TRINITY_DN9018_c0_g1_i1.p1 TRINITY_DN9018_c0_g1~~TRINITY_DN9018_c0_g1_i1.p1  ORF type:complete len:1086 (-),score=273.98 TRINITY_DN9018_c0_g1_i1:98-3355(-)
MSIFKRFAKAVTAESLRPGAVKADEIGVRLTAHHGVPPRATSLAYDCVLNLVAIGCADGAVKIFGQPGIEMLLRDSSSSPIRFLQFIINEGALISVSDDGTVQLWDIKPQDKPSRRCLQRTEIETQVTAIYYVTSSKFVYLGLADGRLVVYNIEGGHLSPYTVLPTDVDATEGAKAAPLVAIEAQPTDANELLLGWASGLLALWDIKARKLIRKYGKSVTAGLTSVSWQSNGKAFVVGYVSGSLSIWSRKTSSAPDIQFSLADTATPRDASAPAPTIAGAWNVHWWRGNKTAHPVITVHGGVVVENSRAPPPLAVVWLQKKGVAPVVKLVEPPSGVVAVEHVYQSPWPTEEVDPTHLLVLSGDGLVNEYHAVDPSRPTLPLTALQQSPVTCMWLCDDPPFALSSDLSTYVFPQPTARAPSGGEFTVSGEMNWPALLLTGHQDGAVRIWDTATVSIKPLITIRVSMAPVVAFALCETSRTLVVSTADNEVFVYGFSDHERTYVVPEVPAKAAPRKRKSAPSQPDSGQAADAPAKPEAGSAEPMAGVATAATVSAPASTEASAAPSVTGSPEQTEDDADVAEDQRAGFQLRFKLTMHLAIVKHILLLTGVNRLVTADASGVICIVDLENLHVITTYLPTEQHMTCSCLCAALLQPNPKDTSTAPRYVITAGMQNGMVVGWDLTGTVVNILQGQSVKDATGPVVGIFATDSKGESLRIHGTNWREAAVKPGDNSLRASSTTATGGGSTGNVSANVSALASAVQSQASMAIVTQQSSAEVAATDDSATPHPSLSTDHNPFQKQDSGEVITHADAQDDAAPSSATAPAVVVEAEQETNPYADAPPPDPDVEAAQWVVVHANCASVYDLDGVRRQRISFKKPALASRILTREGESVLIVLDEATQVHVFNLFSLNAVTASDVFVNSRMMFRPETLQQTVWGRDGRFFALTAAGELLRGSTYAAENALLLPQSSPALWVMKPTPARPAQGFMSSLFSSQTNEEQLFAGKMQRKVAAPAEEQQEQQAASGRAGQAQDEVQSISGVMSDVKDRLGERGEKLRTLDQKVGDIADLSRNMAEMAKQIRKQQESSWF